MICQACREAGQAAQLSRAMVNEPRFMVSALTDTMVTKARQDHAKCRGGTWCDCQHELAGVNWLEINREAR